jgi:hypothetical protein
MVICKSLYIYVRISLEMYLLYIFFLVFCYLVILFSYKSFIT